MFLGVMFISTVSRLVTIHFDMQAEIFGSFETGLYLPSSDIDVSLLVVVLMILVRIVFMIT